MCNLLLCVTKVFKFTQMDVKENYDIGLDDTSNVAQLQVHSSPEHSSSDDDSILHGPSAQDKESTKSLPLDFAKADQKEQESGTQKTQAKAVPADQKPCVTVQLVAASGEVTPDGRVRAYSDTNTLLKQQKVSKSALEDSKVLQKPFIREYLFFLRCSVYIQCENTKQSS